MMILKLELISILRQGWKWLAHSKRMNSFGTRTMNEQPGALAAAQFVKYTVEIISLTFTN